MLIESWLDKVMGIFLEWRLDYNAQDQSLYHISKARTQKANE